MAADKLIALLQKAAAEKLDLAVAVHSGNELAGRVLLVGGRIAWATSRCQPETLGDFLCRIGQINTTELEEATRAYLKHGGTKKLGIILEELGFIERPVLRRCLLLHMLAAVRSLLSVGDAQVTSAPLVLAAEEQLLFAVEHLLPIAALQAPDSGGDKEAGPASLEQVRALSRLFNVPGYVATAVASSSGALRVGHSARRGIPLSAVAVHAASTLDGATRMAAMSGFGRAIHASVRGSVGCAVVTWLDENRTDLALVLISDPAHMDKARDALGAALPALHSWLSHGTVASFFKEIVASIDTPSDEVDALEIAVRVRLGQLRAEGRSDRDLQPLEQCLGSLANGQIAEASRLLAEAKELWSQRDAAG